MKKRKSYRGAGILFYTSGPAGTRVLLVQRKRSGIWSIPGGEAKAEEQDLYQTALRECREEIGTLPTNLSPPRKLRYPFALLGFEWETFLQKVSPEATTTLPDKNARDFHHEFRDAAWFDLKNPPEKLHFFLRHQLKKVPRQSA